MAYFSRLKLICRITVFVLLSIGVVSPLSGWAVMNSMETTRNLMYYHQVTASNPGKMEFEVMPLEGGVYFGFRRFFYQPPPPDHSDPDDLSQRTGLWSNVFWGNPRIRTAELSRLSSFSIPGCMLGNRTKRDVDGRVLARHHFLHLSYWLIAAVSALALLSTLILRQHKIRKRFGFLVTLHPSDQPPR